MLEEENIQSIYKTPMTRVKSVLLCCLQSALDGTKALPERILQRRGSSAEYCIFCFHEMKSTCASPPRNTHDFQTTLTDFQRRERVSLACSLPYRLRSLFCHFNHIFNESKKFAGITLKPSLFWITRDPQGILCLPLFVDLFLSICPFFFFPFIISLLGSI